ncbi:MAG: GGDEF domain-containing protein [Sphingopyxis sp.]|nr:GGDEF domain-containing protein [Sphingopyxis sp.]
MRHTPDINSGTGSNQPLADDDAAGLRAEIARLRRENRALLIALAEMERVAERDMLTPLFNRRFFLSALHQRIARVDRYGDQVTLVYVDVDGLKAINDSFGHAAGDFVLVEIAERLQSAMREQDVLARIGGDEFGILLENTGLTQAKATMRRLSQLIAETPCIYDGNSIALSAAFGLTPITPGLNAEELIGRADSDMYRAKRT